MTTQEFWDALRKSKQKWILDHYSKIRADNDEGYFCPITYICYQTTGQLWDTDAWSEAARVLDLDAEFASRIVDAADGYNGVLRHDLLQILNLAPKQERKHKPA